MGLSCFLSSYAEWCVPPFLWGFYSLPAFSHPAILVRVKAAPEWVLCPLNKTEASVTTEKAFARSYCTPSGLSPPAAWVTPENSLWYLKEPSLGYYSHQTEISPRHTLSLPLDFTMPGAIYLSPDLEFPSSKTLSPPSNWEAP